MADDQKVSIIIEAVDKYSKELEKLQKELSSFSKEGTTATKETSKGFDILGMKIPITTAAIGAAALAMSKFGVDSYNAMAEAETAVVGMEMAMKDAGIQGTKSFIKLSKALQLTTIYSDEELQRSAGLAASFGFTGEQIEGLLPLLTDMASKGTLLTGQTMSLESALRALQMGSEGSERALKQFGITLTQTQVETLKTATEAEKYSMIMDIVSEKTSGAAAVLNSTSRGAIANFKDSWGELQETFGNVIKPLGDNLLGILTKVMDGVSGLAVEMDTVDYTKLYPPTDFSDKMSVVTDAIVRMNKAIEEHGLRLMASDQAAVTEQLRKQAATQTTTMEVQSDGATIMATLSLENENWKKTEEENEKKRLESLETYDKLGAKIEAQRKKIQDMTIQKTIEGYTTEQVIEITKKDQEELQKMIALYDKATASVNGYNRARGSSNIDSMFSGQVSGWKPGMAGGGVNLIPGFSTKVNDFMIAPGGQVLDINPNDTIVGYKDSPPFATGASIIVTGNNIYGVDADNIADALQKKLGNMISIC